ncbi:hypothetical protein HG536_0G01490 [Torulaspora globosa]|uniref:Probable metalloreductase AIM14 n=1 Tax=Torulaspora globosa TaxID=48254 RepID=A0A7G3ZLA4_9SACH|nr:uncharacterized protein HG536_0G01490 [Torulaspora globosa]QLL34290.1 hypothetical protein HG536_0G01490 [Torulaspora globosa]
MSSSLWKRHGETHYANIQYGYYVLGISALYFIFLMVMRKVLPSRPATSSDSKFKKIIYGLYSIDPAINLCILLVLFLTPFYGHYSLAHQTSVYIKRLGRLSYVLLTLNLILNLRPNWLLYRDYTYTDFIPLHKWLSRIIVLIAMVHGILFLIYWGVKDERSVLSELKKAKNFVGLIVMIEAGLLLLFSLGPARRLNYNLFFATHNIFTLSLIFLTAIHARPGVGVPYLGINIFILAVHLISKTVFARSTDLLGKYTDYRNTNLVAVQLPRAALADAFEPGCHIRISPFRRINPLYWLLPSHPFTVASMPSDSTVDLIIAENKHPRSFKLEMGARYTIINNYNPAIPRLCLSSATRVSIVCGGSGISFGLPLYRYFKELHPVDYLHFVWLTRDRYQLKVLEDLLKESSFDGSADFHIFITRDLDSMEQEQQEQDDIDLEFELESFTPEQLDENGAVVGDTASSMGTKIKAASVNLGRRINWAVDLSNFVDASVTDTTWLLTCGPITLIDAGRQYAAGNGINFASEIYAL